MLLYVVAALSFVYGLLFLIAPGLFADLSQARRVNLAWLRNVGAALVSVQGVGTILAIRRRPWNAELLLILGIASLVETAALVVSLAIGEFSAERRWMIWAPAVAAGASGLVYLYAARLPRPDDSR